MAVPFDAELGVTAQSEGFTRYRRWDFADCAPEEYPLMLHHPYYRLYSSQVVKQADLVFALYACGDVFEPEQKRRDFAFYEQITVRDSSLSASIQGIVAAEVGQSALAYDYWRETSLVDLHDVAGNVDDGLHMAALAGSWMMAVAGFGGLRDDDERLSFSPTLPDALDRIAFRLCHRDRRVRVEIRPGEVSYELASGESMTLLHEGQEVLLTADRAVVLPWTPRPPDGVVSPPQGREALRRGVGADTDAPVHEPSS